MYDVNSFSTLFGGMMMMGGVIFFFLAVVWFVVPFVLFAVKAKGDRALEKLEGIERRLERMEARLRELSEERRGTHNPGRAPQASAPPPETP